MKKTSLIVLVVFLLVSSYFLGYRLGEIDTRQEIKTNALRFVDDHPLTERDILIITGIDKAE